MAWCGKFWAAGEPRGGVGPRETPVREWVTKASEGKFQRTFTEYLLCAKHYCRFWETKYELSQRRSRMAFGRAGACIPLTDRSWHHKEKAEGGVPAQIWRHET